jgi:hypothetical protein
MLWSALASDLRLRVMLVPKGFGAGTADAQNMRPGPALAELAAAISNTVIAA